MSAEHNKAIVRRLVEEVWNAGDLSVVEELIAPTYVDHTAPPGWPLGPTGLKQAVRHNRRAFPDLHYTIEDTLAEGDRVLTRWTMHATHLGTIHHRQYGVVAPTGLRVSVGGMTLRRLANGLITDLWSQSDTASMMQQLGVLARPRSRRSSLLDFASYARRVGLQTG